MEIFFNRLEQQLKSQLPFVVYRKPNTINVKTILQKDDALHITKHFEESGFVFSPFDDRKNSVLFPLESSEVLSIDGVVSKTVDISRKPIISAQVGTHKASKEHHINLVKKGVEAIKNDQFLKVVVSRQEAVTLQNKNPISIFKNLLANYASAFVYCWYHPKVGLWLGATPETLLKIEGRQFSIMALAGTQNYNGTREVIWKDKELQEQQFVTDFILDNIKSTVENIKVSELETVKAGNLLHLRTQIKGTLNLQTLKFEALLRSLHPTPAVCGLPKVAAKEFILKNEDYNREFYTGFLGELNFETDLKPRTGKRNIENRAYTLKRKSTQLYVNLRCVQIKDDKAFIYVGGGITETSAPESEWEETVSKSMVIKKVL
ncbi:chorismate-binding protein [Algibacter sp. 2305UL17-15]|uniref:chorismate-binding protein n=1 Tax=Algibacter sp. 2305UL17-15 TaxID=3231268 RepID=UPI0034598121